MSPSRSGRPASSLEPTGENDRPKIDLEAAAQSLRDRAYYYGPERTWGQDGGQGYPSPDVASAMGARWAEDIDAVLQIDCSEPPCIIALSPNDPTESRETFERSLLEAVQATDPRCATGPMGFSQPEALVLVPGLCLSDSTTPLMERIYARAEGLPTPMGSGVP